MANSRFQDYFKKFCFSNQKLNIAFVFLFLFAFLLSARTDLILGTPLQSWLWTGSRHKNVRKKDLTVFQKHYLSNTHSKTYIQYWKTETLLCRLIDDSPLSFVMSTFSYHKYSSTVWFLWASLIAQLVKNLPARQETLVWFLGQEDPLEKGKAAHSSIHEYSSKVWFVELVQCSTVRSVHSSCLLPPGRFRQRDDVYVLRR